MSNNEVTASVESFKTPDKPKHLDMPEPPKSGPFYVVEWWRYGQHTGWRRHLFIEHTMESARRFVAAFTHEDHNIRIVTIPGDAPTPGDGGASNTTAANAARED